MTLDEAIAHCRAVTINLQRSRTNGADECAKDHFQLASWLLELKALREHQERPRGTWLPGPEVGCWQLVNGDIAREYKYWYCSACGAQHSIRPFYKYCPNCGTEMSEGGNDD